MAQNLELEIKVINRFIIPAKRDRYTQFVTSAKNRGKFIKDLHGGTFFQYSSLERVTRIEEAVIHQALARHSITDPTCYIISENSSIDTQTLHFKDVLQTVVGWGAGTILVFGDADVIFVELDGLRNRYISRT